MQTQSKELIFLADSIIELKEQIKALTLKHDEYRDIILSKNVDIIETPSVLITIEEKRRASLNRVALELELGKERITQEFETITEFRQVNVKRRKVA